MVRWVIWSQVGFALVALVATLADRGAIPHDLFPPGPAFLLCLVSVPVCPVVVLRGGRRRKPGSGQLREAIASLGLSAATMLALFPLVQ